MNAAYERDLDLNLLRVFVVVAETGSVTAAARQLYLTQPAISAALKRLAVSVGAPLFVREGRGVRLSARGASLFATARPHLEALVRAALATPTFDARASERTIRIGLSDASEGWLLAPLLRRLAKRAPKMRFVILPVQFRTVFEALASARVDVAITVADEVPAGTVRKTLFTGGFACVFDPKHARLGRRPTLERYLEHEHVIVSYNGDLRGVVEDTLGIERRVRVSVPTFHAIGAIVAGTAYVATVPELVARQVLAERPSLRSAKPPFALGNVAPLEILHRAAASDDPAIAFVIEHIVQVAKGR